ncbi:Pro-Pol polyprotein [Formica fusca]
MQRLWQSKCDWDETVNNEMRVMWTQWRSKINCIESIHIPRKALDDNTIKVELHGFCDASEDAYGACLYLRSILSDFRYTVNLLCAKSRVAPMKKISLPKLELCGAVLLANLGDKAMKALSIRVQGAHYWSDSTIALAWISHESNKWNTFVANRVSEIHRIANQVQWHHVKSQDNPADLLSRGINPEKLETMQIWWKGPAFLHHNTAMLPYECKNATEELPEARVSKSLAYHAVSQGSTIIERFSSFTRLKRAIAYCLRFKNNTSKEMIKTNGPLTVNEINKATTAIIKLCQASEFPQELYNLRKQSQLDSKSKLLTLHPFLDSDDLIRVGGRLHRAPIKYAQKHPIILASKSHLTNLIIKDIHYKNLHAGPQAILAAMHENYWPLNGRNTIRRTLRNCIVCFRTKPVTASQLMGSLPSIRVTPARPFLNTGVDYAGPFSVKILRNKTGKAYLSLFVCLATKAIHLELVSDLSTASFLNAIKRFIARRGKCSTLYSDNGTTFTGTNDQLSELKNQLLKESTQTQIRDFLLEQFIDWKFIPPYAPHMGGVWEASVKLAKNHMRKVIGTTILTFEELYTVLTQIEACLNSRPLTPISNDPTDLQALTPGHFLIGEALNAIPEYDMSKVPTNRLTRLHLLTQIKQNFWTRWSKEYIAQLQQRVKWKLSKKTNIKEGTMVLIKNENTPPMSWPLGRIINIHPGPDNLTRVVTIRTSRGITKRALSKICILPVEENEIS